LVRATSPLDASVQDRHKLLVSRKRNLLNTWVARSPYLMDNCNHLALASNSLLCSPKCSSCDATPFTLLVELISLLVVLCCRRLEHLARFLFCGCSPTKCHVDVVVGTYRQGFSSHRCHHLMLAQGPLPLAPSPQLPSFGIDSAGRAAGKLPAEHTQC
jgi:hypothetical protein